MFKKIKKEHIMFAVGALTTGAIVGLAWLGNCYLERNVPYFVRSNGLKYSIHYLQGKDAVDEIYTEVLGIGRKK